MSGDSFHCSYWDLGGAVSGIKWVEAMDAAKHSVVYKTATHNEELSSSTFQ